MKRIFVTPLTIVFFFGFSCGLLSGCSLYKSDGRKEFESNAPGKVKTSSVEIFQLQSCKKEGPLESWFNAEFPAASYELVIAENDLEVWRTTQPNPADGSVEVRAIQKTETSTQSCLYKFSTMADWDLHKEQFLRELENNLMTQD